MTIETTSICDGCNKSLDEGDEIYCIVCVEELRVEIEELKAEIDDLNEEIAALEPGE